MSTVTGSLEVIPVVSAIPSSVEEAATLLDAFIEKFLSVADFLEIKSEEVHAYGKFVYIGEKGKDFPIMSIANQNNSSYYKSSVLMSTIGLDGKISVSYIGNSFSSPVYNSFSVPISTSYSCGMKYMKTSKGMIFGFYQGIGNPYVTGMLTPMVTEGVEGEFINFAITTGKIFGFSYIPHGVFSDIYINIPTVTGLMIPSGKRALTDVFVPYDNSFPYLKLFSTFFSSLKKFETDGKKYTQAYAVSGYWSLVMEID